MPTEISGATSMTRFDTMASYLLTSQNYQKEYSKHQTSDMIPKFQDLNGTCIDLKLSLHNPL